MQNLIVRNEILLISKLSGFRVGYCISVHRILDIYITWPKLIPSFQYNQNISSLQLLQQLPEADCVTLMRDAAYLSVSSEQRANMAIILSLIASCIIFTLFLKKIASGVCFSLHLPHTTDTQLNHLQLSFLSSGFNEEW